MDKKIIIFAGIIATAALVIVYNVYHIVGKNEPITQPVLNNIAMPIEKQTTPVPESGVSQSESAFVPPLEKAGERVIKKPFGIFITPQNSPVQPERFRGYHTGTDFEIFPEEQNIDVPVKAVCDGKILEKRTASGYGGVLVQSCSLDNQPITVLYGHLKLASISKNVGDNLSVRKQIGILGRAFSVETNGERKHLHLGFHKGSGIDIRGYVQNQSDLSGWINPCSLGSVCQ